MANDFLVRFHGVRGSFPVSGYSTLRFGGNTACVEVKVRNHVIILDAGTGIIGLGDRFIAENNGGKPFIGLILLSHSHHDHTQGFPFFKPAYQSASTIYLFGPRTFDEDLEEVLGKAMLPPYFPVRLREMNSMKSIMNLDETVEIILRDESYEPILRSSVFQNVELRPHEVRIRVLKSRAHPRDGVFVYRIEMGGRSLVYATDTEGYVGGDVKITNFARETDLLIHDAQYTPGEYSDELNPKQGFGHSTTDMAITVARKAGVKKLVIFHHDPSHDDEYMERLEKEARAEFPECLAAREGLEIEL
ncbi:MAG: MBL fold metallo-hydrolase [bacterium]